MKYAMLASLGGELIAAENADYSDYKRFLKCPECKEPVFLRKSHRRNNMRVVDAFVHHEASSMGSTCGLRVNNYSQRTVEISATVAREQRIKILNEFLWKYLKSSLAINLCNCSTELNRIEEYPPLRRWMQEYAMLFLEYRKDLVLKIDIINCVANALINLPDNFSADNERKKIVKQFLASQNRCIKLHLKIAKEALDVFLAPQMREVKLRLLDVIISPECIDAFSSELLVLGTSTEEWELKYFIYILSELAIVFLTVDWSKVLNVRVSL